MNLAMNNEEESSMMKKKLGVDEEEAEYMLENNPYMSKEEFQNKLPNILDKHREYVGETIEKSRKMDILTSTIFGAVSIFIYSNYGWMGYFGGIVGIHLLDYALWYSDNYGIKEVLNR